MSAPHIRSSDAAPLRPCERVTAASLNRMCGALRIIAGYMVVLGGRERGICRRMESLSLLLDEYFQRENLFYDSYTGAIYTGVICHPPTLVCRNWMIVHWYRM
jgi:hypothetical protein